MRSFALPSAPFGRYAPYQQKMVRTDEEPTDDRPDLCSCRGVPGELETAPREGGGIMVRGTGGEESNVHST